ncbi:hypothetical protein MOQ72_19850 [Saccharopolyspora sp. K220]|uniref:hypothetical protein n=1 Tax=Saccharopolyspora soli TaxID=2926618 RepID=UPI001F59E7DB|nr:hypothetical protein [Saccharopolyspora soli]MCI2419703.1 hypothetical protein [Saccharopolyspora soli]
MPFTTGGPHTAPGVSEVSDGLLKLFEEVDQARGDHLEVVEPGCAGRPMDRPARVDGKEVASAVAAEHDADDVICNVHGAVLGEIIEHVVGRVDELSVIDVGQAASEIVS